MAYKLIAYKFSTLWVEKKMRRREEEEAANKMANLPIINKKCYCLKSLFSFSNAEQMNNIAKFQW